MAEMNVKTYEPDNSLRRGRLRLLGEIAAEIGRNRWLTWQLFKRDFGATYRQSLMGLSWAFIIPFVSVGVFILLNRSGVLSVGETSVPYALYAVSGIAIWQLFATGAVLSANALLKAGSMVVKIQFSKKSLVIAAYAQAFIPFLVQLLMAGVLIAAYGVPLTASALAFPFALIPLILFSFGAGLLLALLNAVLRDIGTVVSTLVMFLLLLTPVLFAPPSSGTLALLTRYNMLHYLISYPRDLLLTGGSGLFAGYLVSSAVSLAVCVACLVVFHITEVRIAERI